MFQSDIERQILYLMSPPLVLGVRCRNNISPCFIKAEQIKSLVNTASNSSIAFNNRTSVSHNTAVNQNADARQLYAKTSSSCKVPLQEV